MDVVGTASSGSSSVICGSTITLQKPKYYCETAAPVLNSDAYGVRLTPFAMCIFTFLNPSIKSATQFSFRATNSYQLTHLDVVRSDGIWTIFPAVFGVGIISGNDVQDGVPTATAYGVIPASGFQNAGTTQRVALSNGGLWLPRGASVTVTVVALPYISIGSSSLLDLGNNAFFRIKQLVGFTPPQPGFCTWNLVRKGDNTTSMSAAGHGFKCGKTLTLYKPGTAFCPLFAPGQPFYDGFCPANARIRGGSAGWVLHDFATSLAGAPFISSGVWLNPGGGAIQLTHVDIGGIGDAMDQSYPILLRFAVWTNDNGTQPLLAQNDLIITPYAYAVNALNTGVARFALGGTGLWVPAGRSVFVITSGTRKSGYDSRTVTANSNITIAAVAGGPVTSPECYFQFVTNSGALLQSKTWDGHGSRCPYGVGGTNLTLSRPDFYGAMVDQNVRAFCNGFGRPAVIYQGGTGVQLAPIYTPCTASFADVIRVTATAPMSLIGLELGGIGSGIKLDYTMTFRVGVYRNDDITRPIKYGGVTVWGNTYYRDGRSPGWYRHAFSRTLSLATAMLMVYATVDGNSAVGDRYAAIRALIARPG
ncbi:hypothetical protein ABPG75_009954 [Micractinium tetrahymenae]